MTNRRFKITFISWDGQFSQFLGFVWAVDELQARIRGRRAFGPFGNGQEIEAKRG